MLLKDRPCISSCGLWLEKKKEYILSMMCLARTFIFVTLDGSKRIANAKSKSNVQSTWIIGLFMICVSFTLFMNRQLFESRKSENKKHNTHIKR